MNAHRGRVAIVTGAGSGIGAATVELPHSEGASVAGVDLAFSETADDERLSQYVGDVTDPATNESMAAHAVDRFGGLHAVVLNAGMSRRGRIDELPMEDFDAVWNLNVRAVALGIRAAVPTLQKSEGGAIAVTASTSGLGGDQRLHGAKSVSAEAKSAPAASSSASTSASTQRWNRWPPPSLRPKRTVSFGRAASPRWIPRPVA
ncbi:MAG: NAD(P)-dependent dehydrogenase (short-subunit alcohol dehydrogenase family) [Candidatus Aldehydirespiratoraceae bacterium]|jgi:NAD(P)-dependent dehydrogenase (short-subunit alcohol dehydrogenase family)